jgi:hypothetical protein
MLDCRNFFQVSLTYDFSVRAAAANRRATQEADIGWYERQDARAEKADQATHEGQHSGRGDACSDHIAACTGNRGHPILGNQDPFIKKTELGREHHQ